MFNHLIPFWDTFKCSPFGCVMKELGLDCIRENTKNNYKKCQKDQQKNLMGQKLTVICKMKSGSVILHISKS